MEALNNFSQTYKSDFLLDPKSYNQIRYGIRHFFIA